jgi:hypothetical protein
LSAAAFVGSFTPAAPVAIPYSIFLGGADLYANGASWNQIDSSVGINIGVTLASFGLIKGLPYVPGIAGDSWQLAQAAGSGFLQAGDQGLEGAQLLARTLLGGGSPPTGAIVGGSEFMGALDAAALEGQDYGLAGSGSWDATGGGPHAGWAAALGNTLFSVGTSARRITPSEYEAIVFGRPGNKEPFDIWAGKSGFTRRPDDWDPISGTIGEASLLRWSELDLDNVNSWDFKEFNRKLGEAEADGWLLRNNPLVNQAIWYGPEPLPTSGRAAEITWLLQKNGISYQVVPVP